MVFSLVDTPILSSIPLLFGERGGARCGASHAQQFLVQRSQPELWYTNPNSLFFSFLFFFSIFLFFNPPAGW